MADNGIFSSLDKLGLGMLSDMDLYQEEKQVTKNVVNTPVDVNKKFNEEDMLFDKTFKCPVCDSDFKSKVVRTGKARMIGADADLRPKYEDFDPIKYDSIVCSHCGYAALTRFFSHISPAQIKFIRTNISPFFKGVNENLSLYSYDEAVTRYELALANSVIKKGRASEIAYTCLKLAWLKRGAAENLGDNVQDKEAELKKLKNEEKQYLVKAYEGFSNAMAKEIFPICGMDEWTYVYLVAELGYECEDYTKSMKLLSDLVVAKNATPKLKDKARELRKLMQNKM